MTSKETIRTRCSITSAISQRAESWFSPHPLRQMVLKSKGLSRHPLARSRIQIWISRTISMPRPRKPCATSPHQVRSSAECELSGVSTIITSSPAGLIKSEAGFNAKVSNGTSAGVPFAVWWEVRRIADYCGVDLRRVELNLGTESDWRDQTVFRKCLKANLVFANKAFPSRSDDNAWKTALDSGQKQHQTVAYTAEWSHTKHLHEPL